MAGDYDELKQLLVELLTNRFAPKPTFIRGLLGDGLGNVTVPDRPDKSYVRFNRSATEFFEVFNVTVNAVNDWPVLIGELPWLQGLTQVVGTDWAAYEQSGWDDNVGATSPHSPTHEWPDGLPGSDPINIYMRSIVPLRAYILGTGSTTIYANSYEYENPNTSGTVWGGLPGIDLLPTMSALSTGTARLMGIYLDPSINTLGIVTGAVDIFTDASDPPSPQFPSGILPVARIRVYGGQASIGEVDIRDARQPFGFIPIKEDSGVITVNNGSGATASVGDIGYTDEAGDYQTTTTASDNVSWCVVTAGGANATDIKVAVAGRRTVNYTGSAPSDKDFLVTSTTAGKAQAQATMSPEIFAVCTAAGSGGKVETLLLMDTVFVSAESDNNVYRIDNHSDTQFVATINGAPSATSVIYNAPSAGSEDAIVPNSANELAKARLHNTTRSNYRLITAVNTGAKDIATISSLDDWASGDTITIESQTVSTATSWKYVDLDLNQQTEIPILARSLMFEILKQDSGGAVFTTIYPFQTFVSTASEFGVQTPASAVRAYRTIKVALISRTFAYRSEASGSSTVTIEEFKSMGYWIASP